MNQLSLRTKSLLLIVAISFFPLLLAGLSNYMNMKQERVDSAIESTTSHLKSTATQLSSWLAIRRAEVLVISRTDSVRFGSDEERLSYFNREMVRSGFTYYSIGYIKLDGTAIRTDGAPINVYDDSFFQEALKGNMIITAPVDLSLSNTKRSYILVPVYGEQRQVTGIVYASMMMSLLEPYLAVGKDSSEILRLYDQKGSILYSSDKGEWGDGTSILDEEISLHTIGDKLLSETGHSEFKYGNTDHFVFYEKVDAASQWRLSLEVQKKDLLEGIRPLFWRIFMTIGLSEIIIVILFFLFFATIVKRLEAILAVTELAAVGRFEVQHLAEVPNDEVGKLAASVNGMMEQLKEMFERLEAIINQNQYAFIVLDEQYRLAYINKAAEELLGYTNAEVVGHATPLLFMDMDEIRFEAERLSVLFGREIAPGIEVLKELRNEQFSYEREWTFINKNGRRIPVLHSSNGLRDQNGKFSGVVGMAYDISERIQVEKSRNRLLDIVGSAKDLIASVDNRGRVIYMNRAGKAMLGMSAKEKPATFKKFMNSITYQEIINGAKVAEKIGYWEDEAELLTRSGETLYVSMVVVAHPNYRTGELFFSCIARDISEQKIIQEELIRATREAEEANTAKGEFLALMSHEIRTPLNGIIGLSHLMRRTVLTPTQQDYMSKINTSSDTLLHIINDILDFSKIESGNVEVEQLAFKPEELISRLTDQLSIFMGGKEQFEFIVDIPLQLPNKLLGDALRLEQILLNLCMNAIKFTNQGRVLLRLEVAAESKEHMKLHFIVEDTGIGMSKEQQSKLFVPFTQADTSTTRKYGGTGLGLVISNSLVEMMGGKLKVESKLKRGSKFSFTLSFPIITPASVDTHIVSEQMMEQPIWIVEDNDDMRKHWCDMAESFRLTPVAFSSWKSAKERLQRIGAGAMPKLIMLDMEMPDMYGLDTWLAFHEYAVEAGVKTIVLTTTFGRDEMQQMPESDRPAALLTKPISRLSMFQTISGVLGEQTDHSQLLGGGGEAAASHAANDNIRILLVEDNPINQLVAVEILRERGFEVGVAHNGREALELLEKEPWHLILMDIHMPEMDGMEATQIIRSKARYAHVPIIAVTANTLRVDHDQYMSMGMNDVVTKPIHEDQLYSSIMYWLKRMGHEAEMADWEKLPDRAGEMLLPVIEGIDLSSALTRVNGKLPILLHMLEQFQRDYEGFSVKLISRLESGEIEAAKRMVHTLLGVSGNLSAAGLAGATAELNLVLKGEHWQEMNWKPLANRLEEELSIIIVSLKNNEDHYFDNIS